MPLFAFAFDEFWQRMQTRGQLHHITNQF